MAKKFYVTTPIYYVNDVPHLGHSYTTIVADVLSRYHRLKGEEVFFLTGTDEHGTKVEEAAKKVKKTPQDFCDEIASKFKKAWETLNIKPDNFIRTTDPHHEAAVTQVLQKFFDEGYIYKGKYQAFYCVGCEQYKTKSELIDGKCPDHNLKPEERIEKCYLFKLSSFQQKLLNLIEKNQLKIEPPPRKNEMVSFLKKERLQDLAISRPQKKVSWGIPLPFDPSHTTYVWVDAFLNYLTGLGWPKSPEKFGRYWPPDVQLMAKDILRVHATIWPAMLLALKLELPKKIFVHGYFTVDGKKMSKSLGNVIDPNALSKNYGPDSLRYFLLSEFPFGTDGNFSLKRLEEAYHFDLANDLGNLLYRTLPMIEKYYQGKIPQESEKILLAEKLKEEVLNLAKGASSFLENLKFRESLQEIWKAIRLSNKYIDQAAPWSLAKGGKKELDTVLNTLAETIRLIALLIYPYLPESALRIWNQLGIKASLEEQNLAEALSFGKIPRGTLIKPGKVLFPRL